MYYNDNNMNKDINNNMQIISFKALCYDIFLSFLTIVMHS